jgi:CheY-like chemotaxis protein
LRYFVKVMMNLGRNSIKFTPQGFVRFRATVAKDGLVELYVEDSGQGIPADKQDALFEKFQKSLDVLSQGTGVGLSLCKTLTRLLNGCIFLDKTYESEVPGSPGARFVVQLNQSCLPAESILSSTVESSSQFPVETLSGRFSQNSLAVPENISVLFVDDDNVLRKLFCRAVKKAAPSWTITEAASGEAALQLVKDAEAAYDVIFIDQYMASVEKQLLGTDTVRELRAQGTESIICGLSANSLEESFLSAGADAFLLKPLPCKKEAMEGELARICPRETGTMATQRISSLEIDNKHVKNMTTIRLSRG